MEHMCGIARVRVSTTVDEALLDDARRANQALNDAALLELWGRTCCVPLGMTGYTQVMPPSVYVCRKCKGHNCVIDFLEEMTAARIEPVKCQKVCDGALVGFEIDGRLEWFARVAKPKPLVAIAKTLEARPAGANLRKPLAKRRVIDHIGRPPRR
jgi:hypothetical protein